MEEYVILTKKICINPTLEQIEKINTIFNLERYLWNKYIELNDNRYKNGKKFISYKRFDKLLTWLKRKKKDYKFLKEIPKYSRQNIVRRCEDTYIKFFEYCKDPNNHIKVGLPKFKSKRKNPITSYFFEGNQYYVSNNFQKLYIRFIDENHIHLPHLKNMEIKQTGYLLEEDLPNIVESCIKYEKNKYYVCLCIKYPVNYFIQNPNNVNLGIDVGINNYMSIYYGYKIQHIPNINEDKKIKRLEERIKILQRKASKKMELNRQKYGYKYADYRCISNNVAKIYTQIFKLYTKIKNIREDYMKKIVNYIVTIIKPRYITIENLNIKDMLKNGHGALVKHLQDTGLGKLLNYLAIKASIFGIEVRMANQYYASSKTCCRCGNKKKDLQLSDRIYHCKECGLTLNRDANAAVNLYKLTKYKIFRFSVI